MSPDRTERSEHAYIFLNPDGSRPIGLLVIIDVSTGVIYASQCGGIACEVREAEGFAVPVGGPADAEPFRRLFRQRFGDNPTDPRIANWPDGAHQELASLVGHVPLWRTTRSDDLTAPAVLELDRTRLVELTDAWIPVRSVYGPGWLLFDNGD